MQGDKRRDHLQDFIKHNQDEIASNKNENLEESHNTIEARANTTDKTPNKTKSHKKRSKTKKKLFDENHNKNNDRQRHSQSDQGRIKRDTILDRGINHGGNAQNHKAKNATVDSSTSSFENALLECYDGEILVAKYFPPSNKCSSVKYLEQAHLAHLSLTHEVNTDGYYYYIFYSDNDDEQNHIHAIFDIHKPTFLYSNISETKGCINSTDCQFPIQMFSDEVVIVEVPTRDGIEHEDDDITLLISQCVPRMSVYMIFPILVLIFILCCAFI